MRHFREVMREHAKNANNWRNRKVEASFCGTVGLGFDQASERCGDMVLFPASFVILVFWFIAVLRSGSGAYLMALAMLPFGMFAVVQLPSLGGLSITAATLFAAMAAGIATSGAFFKRNPGPLRFNPASLALGLFCIYSVFSALVLVRYFQGSFLVFPVARGATGIRIDPSFPSVMAPLTPSNANLSQTFYIVIAFAFFVAFCGWLRRTGPVAGERLFAIAAGLNVVLGILNIAQVDVVLSWVQTATYSLHDQQTMAGLRRAIGGFPEPAPFGSASAVFFAYFASAWAHSQRRRDFLLALFNAVFVILSYSTTGFAALMVVFLVFALRLFFGIHARTERRRTTFRIAGYFFVLAVGTTILALTPLLGIFIDLLDRLFLSKLDSLSGQERSAWTEAGMNAFFSTWGLGGGTGSLRSNGMVPVLLGSVGLPGTIAFAAFLWLTIGRSARAISDPVLHRIYVGAQVAALAQLTGMMLSMTVPDPTLVLIVCCALAAIARETAMRTSTEPARRPEFRARVA